MRLPKIAAATALRPTAFRLTVHADPLRVKFDTAGWEQSVLSRELERDAVEHWQEQGGSFRLDRADIRLAPATNHVYMEIFSLLNDAVHEFHSYASMINRAEPLVLALAIEPDVSMTVVSDLILTATRAGIYHVDLLLQTSAGPGRVSLWLNPPSEHRESCNLTTVTVEGNEAFVSLATLEPMAEVDHLALLTQGKGLPDGSPNLTNHRMLLLDPDRKCPTVSARKGVLDVDALLERLAETRTDDGDDCPTTPLVLRDDTSWGTAAAWMAKLDLAGYNPALLHGHKGFTDCTSGIRPGDREFAERKDESPPPREAARSTVRLGTPEVTGPIDPKLLHRIVRAHTGKLQWCSDQRRKVFGFAWVSTQMRFTIAKNGRVKKGAQLSGDSEVPKPFETCLTESFERMTFPTLKGATTVVYPIVFR